jgi:hypothetical protein
MVEKHFNISIAPVRSRGGSLVINIGDSIFLLFHVISNIHKESSKKIGKFSGVFSQIVRARTTVFLP